MGKSERAHFESLAAKGHVDAIAELEPPPFPRVLLDLWELSLDLHGQSGYTQDGQVMPLTYFTIAGYVAVTGEIIRPHEAQALMRLDRARLYPRNPDEKVNGSR